MRHKFRRTTLISVFCLALVVGIALASQRLSLRGPLLILLLPLGFLLKKKNAITVIAVIVAGLSIGLWRGSVVWQERTHYQKYFDQKVTFQVRAMEDAVYGDRAQMEFVADSITPEGNKLPGKISIRGFGERAIYRGDTVEITGKLRQGKGSVQGYISFAELKVIERSINPIDALRRRFVAALQSTLPSPHASLGLGLLIGQRNLLPEDLNDSLGRVGLAHIVAVSGYNLTVLVNFVRRISGKRSKFQSLAFSFLLIALFLMMSGLSPSIIRAAIVSVLALLAWYFGRKVKPMVLIALAAAITGMAQPLYVWGDLGWYLSFLAFFGVLVAAPSVLGGVYKKRKPHPVTSVLAETICAQLFTAPIVMLVFGQISVIGLVANIAVVPTIPYAMVLTAISGLSGMAMPIFSGWFTLPGRYILGYIVETVRFFDRLPFAAMNFKISVVQMSGLYALLALAVWILHRKTAKISLLEKEF